MPVATKRPYRRTTGNPRQSKPAPAATVSLAIHGARPVFAKSVAAPWPPTDDATLRDLVAVYRSRRWGFNEQREQAFTRAFAGYHSARHGVMMVNGTVTLEAILASLEIGRGDEVIVPALTWMSTAMAVHYVGATPVFVDVEPTTLCLDPTKLEAARTARTRAVIPVHLYGSMADLEAIDAWARPHGIAIVEDCAHMHGGMWNGRGVGSWGVAGSFSFQHSKPLAAGEGGITITNDDALAERLYRYKHIGYADGDSQGRAGSGPPVGFICHNYRATEFQAVILHHQLTKLKQRIRTYNASTTHLEKRIAAEPETGLRVQMRGRLAGPQGYYSFVILADEGPLAAVPMTKIFEAIRAEGVNTGESYGPAYQHRLWNLKPKDFRLAAGGCPVAERVGLRAIVMPHPYLGLPLTTIDRIAEAILRVARHPKALT